MTGDESKDGSPAAPGPECVPDRVLAEFRAGRLSEGEEELLFGHVAVCRACERRLGAGLLPAQAAAVFNTLLPALGGVGSDSLLRANEERRYPYLGPPAAGHEHDAGSLLNGKYRVASELGSGGFATVFLGYDALDRPVAIKVANDPRGKGPLGREARALNAAQDAPQIIRIHDIELDHSPPFIVLEFVPGETLAERLKALRARGEAMGHDLVAQVALDLARGLSALHEKGWVHQDVKPGNIILPAETPRPPRLARHLDRFASINPSRRCQARLFDLGLAFNPADRHTRPPGSTADYESPEQKRPKAKVGTESDVYSLGAVLFEMITGRPPVGMGGPDVKAELGGRGAPSPLLEVCVACLNKDPRKRPKADKVADDLARHAGRHRRRLVRWAVVVVALAALGTWYHYHRLAETARTQAARAGELEARLAETENLLAKFHRGNEERLDRKTGPLREAMTGLAGESIVLRGLADEPELVRMAERLTELVNAIESDSVLPLPDRAERVLRVARATLALYRFRFDEALAHLPADQVEVITADAAEHPALAYQANLARARALELRGDWAGALRHHRVAARLVPDGYLPQAGVARCHYFLRQWPEAEKVWGGLVTELKRTVGPEPKRGNPAFLLIDSLVGRAAARAEMGPGGREAALDDYAGAYAVLTALRAQGEDGLDEYDWQISCNRVLMLLALGKTHEALLEAAAFADRMPPTGERPVYHIGMARMLINRLNKSLDTLDGQDRTNCSLAIFTFTVERGRAYLALGKHREAIDDASAAVALVRTLPADRLDEHKRTLLPPIAYRLRARGYVELFKAGEKADAGVRRGWVTSALADMDAVVTHLDGLLKQGRLHDNNLRRLAEAHLGMNLRLRSQIHLELGEVEAAQTDIDRSVEALGRLVAEHQLVEWAEDLAASVVMRERVRAAKSKQGDGAKR